ncbi:hypothetical protein SmphiM12_358 [Sinorhizobium phage phiM12]|uniref:Uncharacterized protein n=1 Tax=Sinorhizobium phage phiM12 TaxID=1357423 RepID=S5MQ88_9CAUD|nr:hypothetical protein AB690_gp237 [Sinorhizobium phage phiM12]AGR47990.1 hypothetical protein SmphiM12_358 [Sinorhizobium phage phiM12]AKF13177.1 hypothetical protein PHIM19_272 [Sinorhizobium phage phiM19]
MLYERFARDLSEELFNSVYDDLMALAESQQKSIHAAKGKREKIHAGECQEKLNAFCHGKLSLGDALDFIKIQKI